MLVKSFRWSTDIDVSVMASACFFLCGDKECNYLQMSYWGWGCVRSMNRQLSFTTCSYSNIIEQVITSDDLHSWWSLSSRLGIRLHLPGSTPGQLVMGLMIFEVIIEYLINGWRSHGSKPTSIELISNMDHPVRSECWFSINQSPVGPVFYSRFRKLWKRISRRSAPFYVTQHLSLDLQMKRTRMI